MTIFVSFNGAGEVNVPAPLGTPHQDVLPHLLQPADTPVTEGSGSSRTERAAPCYTTGQRYSGIAAPRSLNLAAGIKLNITVEIYIELFLTTLILLLDCNVILVKPALSCEQYKAGAYTHIISTASQLGLSFPRLPLSFGSYGHSSSRTLLRKDFYSPRLCELSVR